MGLWDFLTRDISLSSAKLKWREPVLYRTRLKEDLHWRFVLVLSAWLIGTGVLAVLFSFNQTPPHLSMAFGLGLVFGLGPALLMTFLLKEQVSGSFWLYDDRIVRQRTYASFAALGGEQTTWEYGVLADCQLLPAKKSGLSFHVLFFRCEGTWELIGIPTKIDISKLHRFLQSRGVEVSPAAKLPKKFRHGLSLGLAGGFATVALVTLSVGIYLLKQTEQIPTNADAIVDRGINIPDFHPPNVKPQSKPNQQPPSTPIESQTSPAPSIIPQPRNIPELFPSQGPGRTPLIPNGFAQSDRLPATSQPVTKPEDIGNRSKLVGGTGGFPFVKAHPQGKPVIGIRYIMGSWAGKEHLGSIDPLYANAANQDNQIVAKLGYVLSGIEIHAPEFVDGIRLRFTKLSTDGSLNLQDSYTTEWIGEAGDNPVNLSNNQSPIIGFHGKGGAVLDSLGVLFAK